MARIRRVALLGGGVIGAGWAARLAMNGIDCTVYDPDPEAGRRVTEVLANAERAYRRLTLAPLHTQGALRVTGDLGEALEGADFCQESAPEREDLKRALLAEASRGLGPEVVIASSSSGLLPSRLQADCAHPERVCIGHPFNPVYLLPLVEVVGGAGTAAATRERAAAFYRSIGMHPLIVVKEIDAFIADRLMEALWREALHLVAEGVATTGEIDEAIRYGPGLRWSFMGTFLTYRLAGGEAGMRHFLAQFGPTLKLPWTRFDGPELTDGLIDRIAAQSDEQAGGRSIRELERLRDDCLVAVLQGLRGCDFGAGATLRAYEERLYEVDHARVMGEDDDLSAPLRLHRARVPAEWVDYNGHLTESRYLQVFGDASDALFRYLGIDAGYHAAGLSYFTAETHIRHLAGASAGEAFHCTTQILGADPRRLHIFHAMHRDEDGALLATGEQMLLHVDTRASRTCPLRADVAERLARLAAAHAALPAPEGAGRSIAMPAKE